MVVARQLHQPGPGDPLGHVAAGPDVRHPVAGTVQHQHRRLDRAEHRADVHRAEGADAVIGLGRCGRRQVDHPPPCGDRRVGRLPGREHVQHPGRVLGGQRRDPGQQVLELLGGRAPRVVLVAERGRVGAEGDHRRHLVGVGSRHQQGQPAAGVAAEQGHPLRADGGHDGLDVVHLVLEHVVARPAVRQAAAHPVVQQQPRERRQLVEEGGERGVLPQQPQVGRPAEREDEVQVAIPGHLVGDAAAVGALGVVERRAVAHARKSMR